MKHSTSVAALAAIIAIGVGDVASAATIDLGSFSGTRGSNSARFGENTNGAFGDLFTFTVTGNVNVSISVTNGFSTSSQVISPFTLSLYGTPDGTGAALKSVNANTNQAEMRQTASIFDALSLGSYSFSVSGSSDDSPSYGGSLSVSISPVPLPASAPLFGGALLAVGLAGYGMKRRKGTVAV